MADPQRTIKSDLLSGLEEALIIPIVFIDMAFRPKESSPQTSERLCLHNHVGTQTFGYLQTERDTNGNIVDEEVVFSVTNPGNTIPLQWMGVGDLGEIEEVEETEELVNVATKLSLSGVNSDIVQRAVEADYYRAPITLYIALLDPITGAVSEPNVDTPVMWSGYMDYMEIKRDANSTSIILTAENEDVDMHRPNGAMLSNAAQQQEFPGDTGLKNLARMVDLSVRWPASDPITIGTSHTTRQRKSIGYYR